MKDLKNYHYILDGSPKDQHAAGLFSNISGIPLHDKLDSDLSYPFLRVSKAGHVIWNFEDANNTTPITLEELIELLNEKLK